MKPLEDFERMMILICRDYICTEPKALDLFLRAINWFDPLQVNIAKLYITKWKKITLIDAVSLLDARFPCSFVREYAISVISEYTDDLIQVYMLQLCQCLMYELYHNSPLANFIIQRSLKSPKLIGSSFFWNSIVGSQNKLFKQRLSLIALEILMLAGPTFIDYMEQSIKINEILKQIASTVKDSDPSKRIEVLHDEIKEKCKSAVNLPIHPTFYLSEFLAEACGIFSSKMVPLKLVAKSKIPYEDNHFFNVIYKVGKRILIIR